MRQPAATFARAVATKAKATEMLKATSKVAEQLEATGIWKRKGGRKTNGAAKAIEPHRVNIVSEKLCGMYIPSFFLAVKLKGCLLHIMHRTGI